MIFKRVLLLCCWLTALVHAEPLTLPLDQRPEWLSRDGIVMAGSWEPLIFRVRRDGSDGYVPTDEQREAYRREHSQEMIDELKALGVNFVMMHCYKGGGLQAEKESMADAVRFSKLCHDAGLRVGVYNYSGAFIWELLFKETPQAKDWVVLDQEGKPVTYGRTAAYRYYWNRNHPDAQAFYRGVIRFAVEDIRSDLLHFDNYVVGPGRDANSVQRFRQYLRDTFTPVQLEEAGVKDLDTVEPPMTGPPDNLLRRAWLDFSCKSLADSYHDMSRYARTLRKDILIECNPGGIYNGINPPVDQGRLLAGGEAFWDEGLAPGYRDGQVQSRIRTYKVARRMNNMAFAYTTTPLEMGESMAFNRDCLGCVCWFEYGRIVDRPGSKDPVSPDLEPFIRFFHKRRDLLRDADVVADVAVLRSFPSLVFADPKSPYPLLPSRIEQAFIENRTCFQIIYDCHLEDLKRYRVVVLAGCLALSDRQIEQLTRYVESGGKLCLVGPVATHDEWMMLRSQPALSDLPPASVLHIAENGDVLDAVRRLCDDKLSLSVEAAPGLCAELTEQPGRRLVHLINYRSDGPVKDVALRARLPAGLSAKRVTLVSPQRNTDLELPFSEKAHLVTFSVPAVPVYEIVVIETGKNSG